jgi:hypothetical protein
MKELSISWQGSPATVKLKKLTFGEKNAVQDAALTVSVEAVGDKTVTNTKLSMKALKENTLLRGITEAPFKVDMETIQGLPSELGDTIYNELNELNGMTPEKKPA